MTAEKSGPHVSDEAFKMALTDALSVALKMIGVAADIYLGLFDGSKYVEQKTTTQKTEVTVGDIAYVGKQIETLGIDKEKFLAFLGARTLDEMTPLQFEKALTGLKMKAKELEAPAN